MTFNFPTSQQILKGFILPFIVLVLTILVTSFRKPIQTDPEFLSVKSTWADSVFQSLTPEERIAQLFMVAAYSNKGAEHVKTVEKLVSEYKIGGLIFFKGGPIREAKLTNYFQSKAKTPLFIAIDGEWGVSMRLDSTEKYPRQMMLGAIQNDELVYKMGEQIADQCKLLGIHINFAPVIDVNNNSKNPVINNRSFGENKALVAKLGLAYMKGMQDNGVIACGKHFPGHGDTDSDSHKTLPIINHNYKRLDSLELYPFKQLIDAGLMSMMVAHLYIPELDNTPNQASTLSPKIVNGLLKDSLGFKGLVFTDALNMKGVSKYYAPGEVDVKAILAGNDILLFPEDVPVGIAKIKSAIANGEITQKEIDDRCLKILKAKEWAGLNHYKPIDLENLVDKLNPVDNIVLSRALADESITLIQNQDNFLPLKRLDSTKMVYLNIGGTGHNEFHKMMNYYTQIEEIKIPRSLSAESEAKLRKKLAKYDRIIIGYHRTNNSPRRNFGITKQAINLQNDLAQTKEVVSVVFGNPYVLESFGDQSKTKAIIVAYQDTKYTRKSAGELIFGGIVPKGKLPVTGSSVFTQGLGLSYDKPTRLHFAMPEELNYSVKKLNQIDEIVKAAIKDHVFPGCQVLAIKENNLFYYKSFGYFTYQKKQKVEWNTIYDLASVTKIAATTYSLMQLTDKGLINLDSTLNHYLLEIVGGSRYANITLREMLAHQAGFISWIPFYRNTQTNGELDPFYYSSDSSAIYSQKVAEDIYIKPEFQDSIFNRILRTPLRKKRYKYSDIGYYFLKVIIEKETGMKLEDYVQKNIYQPMGLSRMTYHPLYKFSKNQIPPTVNDTVFRNQVIWGDVNDQGAATLGGVGGHAGLFSNALDLGQLMYALINNGEYGGVQYVTPQTIQAFTKCQYCPTNRRGAGFDKPVRSLDGGPTCSQVSLSSFGHSGFTGTYTWADPEHDLVYVFLSNRSYPNDQNWKIVKQNIRTNIQDVLYDVAGNK
ncbi:MAG: glycoside hydrolase family 3 N-terminal domain-containing protein [Putridiphycobacter sp.]